MTEKEKREVRREGQWREDPSIAHRSKREKERVCAVKYDHWELCKLFKLLHCSFIFHGPSHYVKRGKGMSYCDREIVCAEMRRVRCGEEKCSICTEYGGWCGKRKKG
jgi:hypothetical protein